MTLQVRNSSSLINNNFDLLRVLLATTVFLVHTYVLSGSLILRSLADILSSEIAVKSFFVVSGFLIFMSFENSSNISNYFSKRLRRIYPAYFSVIVLCSLMGVFITTLPVADYFSLSWVKYLFSNLLFLNFVHPDLPGLFTKNPINAVNGALWTLKIEVMFYLFVPLIVFNMRKFGYWKILLLLYVISMLYRVVVEAWGLKSGSTIYLELTRQFPGQLVYFIAGAILYYNLEIFKQYRLLLLALAVVIMFLRQLLPVYWLEPMAIAIIIVYFACVFPWLGDFSKYGDFSYGIYILHFPILQTLIQCGMFKKNPISAFLIAVLVVLITAYLFWHWIEKPFLRRASHYVEVSK